MEEKRILQQIRQGVLLEHYETVRRRKDGSLVQIALTISPIRDSSGRIIGASKSGRDISRRKEAEWALQRSETKLRTALDAGKLGAWDWDIAHNRVTWTDRLYEFHGLPPGSFAGTVEAFSALLHPDDRERVATALDKSLLGKAPYQVEFRTIRPDGEVRWLVTAAQLIRNERGEPERMVGVTQDVTERVQAQLALQQSEAWFRRLADTMPQLVWTADPTGRVDYYNQRIRSYAGATQDGNGNWHWEPIIHPDDLATTTATWERAVKTSSSYTRTHRTRMADGSYRWHLSRALPVRNANGTVAKWFGTATDIDDQKRTEEQLEAVVAQRTLKLRETVAELEAFSYSIAHDLRAPLRSMSGYAAILLSDHGARLDAEARDFLQRIEASAERLDRLIQDVLNYSKVVRGDMDLERVDFGALAEEIILSYPHLREPDAAILLAHPLPAVLGNPAALTQVISNLLGNAVKFVPPGAKPEVRVRSEPAPNGFIRFWFEDNGIGIDPESLDRIFQMFQQLNSADQYEGTGIGLSIVRKAAEKMGGRVGVESTPGQGSRFWVELKAAQNPVPSAG